MAHDLPTPLRFITTHTDDGLSTFSSISNEPPMTQLHDMQVSFCYGTTDFPVRFKDDADLTGYQHLIENPTGIVNPHGAAFRMVDFPPGYATSMHRTVSLNFNVVIEGELELILDSGETRLLRRGHSVVQRAINHSWRNPSDTYWARVAAFVLPAEPLSVGEQLVQAGGLS